MSSPLSHLPPSLKSALACAESLSFLAMHWYTPLSALCTEDITSCSPLFWIRILPPTTPAPRGIPLCSHSKRGAGQPPQVQLMIAVPPLFTTWWIETLHFLYSSQVLVLKLIFLFMFLSSVYQFFQELAQPFFVTTQQDN